MTPEANVTEREYPAIETGVSTLSAGAPQVFLLPGLIDDDPGFDRAWNPLRRTFRVVNVTYLDWTELIQPHADVTSLIGHIRRQIESRLIGDEPLRIVGYSVGGLWAYACALALQSEGRDVMCLTVLDAPAKIEEFPLPLSKRIRHRFRSLTRFRLNGALASVLAKCLSKRPFWPLLRRLSRFRHSPLPFNFERHLHRKITMQLELQLFQSWWQTMARPASLLTAPTFIFRSDDYHNFKDECLGWRDYCPNCTVIRVAGDHGSMLHTENTETLAALIIDVMEIAQKSA